MRFLASFDVFRETLPKEFELTPSAALLAEGTHTMRSFVRMFASEWNQRPFAHLTEAIRTGKSAFRASMGGEIFEYLNKEPEAGALFNRVMGDFLAPVHRAVARAGNFSDCKQIVDVGGGRGSLLVEILRQHPLLQGLLLDTPAVVDEATKWISEQGFSKTITPVPGNFFDSVPRNGDLYLLCRVIHDWDDKEAIRILSAVRRAMKPKARLMIIDQIMPPGNDPSFIKTTDLWMMLIFHEGRERTHLELREILEAAGLRLSNIVKTEVSDVIIEALPN
jgi:hypothetical protein